MCTSAAKRPADVISLNSDDEPGPPTSRRQPPVPTYSRAPGRPACPFGINCYRRNPAHFESEDHPAEHPLLAAANSQQSQQRPAAVPAPAAAASAPAPAASEESNAGDGARAEPASAASSGSGGPSADITIPSRYANPAVFLRVPKKDRPVEPVRIPLLRPFVGDNSLLIGHFNGATTSSAPVCKLAGFDFDDTLSERKAAGGKDKWRSSFWNHRFGSSPAMLRALHARGYRRLVLAGERVSTEPSLILLGRVR